MRRATGSPSPPANVSRRRLVVQGIVQGVGFRPFVFHLAQSESLGGFATNTSDGVVIEVEGAVAALDRFAERLASEAPPLAEILSVSTSAADAAGDGAEFEIRASVDAPGTRTLIPPDVATCPDCRREVLDPADRRHRYPFTNCTNCGPRWTIIQRIPYDRPFTSMALFNMCPRCAAEYADPNDRRFHAQPNACPDCGPKLWLEDETGPVEGDALEIAAKELAAGRVVAIKGLGGFHLAVRADDETAVERLRERKHREAKPLAVMCGDLRAARELALITPEEAELLTSPRAPIVLVEKESQSLAASVARGHRQLGVMLAYTPLHLLLFDALKGHGIDFLIMTSGNASDEPICLGNEEARSRLKGIADLWLLHDRDIVRRADDSVVQIVAGETSFLRRSRGYAPVPILVQEEGENVLAVGPQMKNTVCVLKEDRAFVSPHVGDLENLPAYEFFAETIDTLQGILECEPHLVAHDLHPRYSSTRWARELRGVELEAVQHHHAHLAAVMAEHGIRDRSLGVILDGTGYGTDGTIWGGEILVGDRVGFERLGHLETMRLPGGEAAVKQPWRTALSALRQVYGDDLPHLPWMNEHPVDTVLQMIDKELQSPRTSSCGRLFDAVAALTGRWGEVHYEAQAAIEMMALTNSAEAAAAEPFPLHDLAGEPFQIPLAPFVRGTVSALHDGASTATISARFHSTLVEAIVLATQKASRLRSLKTVCLGGGVFQNEILRREGARRLREEGFTVYLPVKLPANDGAVAVGQAVVARARLQQRMRKEL